MKTKTKVDRHNLIREYIKGSKVRSQEELVDYLQEKGFAVTQATVSRDIAELSLVKNGDGFYVMAEDEELKNIFQSLVKTVKYSGNIVVINTLPAAAQTVARYIDKAAISGVLGSVAGDDTIFVLIAENVSNKAMVKNFQELKENKNGSK